MSDITGKFHDLAERALIERDKARAERDKAVEALRETELTLEEWQKFPVSGVVRLTLDMVERAAQSIRATLAEIEGE